MDTENRKADFTEQYLAVHSQLARYCKALAGDLDEAEELMAETVAIAFEKFDIIRKPASFKYFLFGIAIRRFRKKLSRKRERAGLDGLESIAAPIFDPGLSGDVDILYNAIAKLPERQKEIIVLFELSGFSLQEISELKNMNLSTVKTNLARARQELAYQLNPTKEKMY